MLQPQEHLIISEHHIKQIVLYCSKEDGAILKRILVDLSFVRENINKGLYDEQ